MSGGREEKKVNLRCATLGRVLPLLPIKALPALELFRNSILVNAWWRAKVSMVALPALELSEKRIWPPSGLTMFALPALELLEKIVRLKLFWIVALPALELSEKIVTTSAPVAMVELPAVELLRKFIEALLDIWILAFPASPELLVIPEPLRVSVWPNLTLME
jgi:hypothetical protein